MLLREKLPEVTLEVAEATLEVIGDDVRGC